MKIRLILQLESQLSSQLVSQLASHLADRTISIKPAGIRYFVANPPRYHTITKNIVWYGVLANLIEFEDCPECSQWQKEKVAWFEFHLDSFVENPISYLCTTGINQFLPLASEMNEGFKKANEILKRDPSRLIPA